MTTPIACCTPCPTVQTVNVPGPEGPEGSNGTNGTDGINAFTQTTADFVVPALGANVTVSVVNSDWMTVGQNIFVQGAGTFAVVSKPTSTSVILTYLNYTTNTATGNTIATGANASPAGLEPSITLLPSISSYGVGGTQALTTSPAQALAVTITLTASKSYLIIPTVRFDYDVATFSPAHVITATLRRTNNTPSNVANAIAHASTGERVTDSSTVAFPAIPAVVYSATAGDIIQLYVSIDVAPYSGAVNVVEASILAIPLF